MYISSGLAVMALAMAYLGYHYSIPATASRQKRILLRMAFVVLGGLSMALIVVQGYRTDKDQQRVEGARVTAEANQKQTQQTLEQTQRKVDALEGQVKDLTNKFYEPSGPTEKLSKMAEVLGIQLSPSNFTPLTTRNDILFQGGIEYLLASLMRADGYTGTTMMAEVYVTNQETNQSTIQIGTQPSLTAKNSDVIEIGDRFDYREGADTRTIRIRSEKGGKLKVTFRPR